MVVMARKERPLPWEGSLVHRDIDLVEEGWRSVVMALLMLLESVGEVEIIVLVSRSSSPVKYADTPSPPCAIMASQAGPRSLVNSPVPGATSAAFSEI